MSGLHANPDPLRVVTVEQRAQWWRQREPRTRDEQRAQWVRLGGDGADWDAEHPPMTPTSGDAAAVKPNPAGTCVCCGLLDDTYYDGTTCARGHVHCLICVGRGHHEECVRCEDEALPDELVIEDSVGVLRPARPDDYGRAIAELGRQ
jgi:hypothetical protein